MRLHPALCACPVASDQPLILRVSPDAERRLRLGHPWLYDQAIRKQNRRGHSGDLAAIYDRRERFLAIGLYDPDSAIRVRVLQARRSARINEDWFGDRLRAAIELRHPLATPRTTGYRLVHGENDRLPGLVLDRYDSTLVMKLYTAAWIPHLRMVVEALVAVWPLKRLVLRLSRALQHRPERLHGLEDGMLLIGPAIQQPVIFLEQGLRFEVDPIHGQKTGFFLDQRDNRAKLEPLSAGRSILDGFAYTGAFSVYAARGGAREVTSVDASRPALLVAQRNMALNRNYPGVAAVSHHLIPGDVFEVLERLQKRRVRFDLVNLDPPAFAKMKQEIPAALLAYARLTRVGVGLLRPEGLLVISSCSSQISAEQFFTTVRRAAKSAGRPLRELERTGHPLDHPIRFPEGAYLKGLFVLA